MTKILSHHENKKVEEIVIVSLVVSIVLSSFFILYSPDQNIRNYNALLMSAISIGIALVICLVQVFRYRKSVRKQRSFSRMSAENQLHHYYDNNKMHFSICLFLGLWLAAQLMWLSQYEEAILWFFFIADVFFFIGYASFGQNGLSFSRFNS
jgi:divalent metal cation (Fe/Co/Zn/Cd) transporter